MVQFGKKIVKCRIPILIISVLLLIPAVFGFVKTRINYDILYYLPDDIETMQGQDILMDEFGKGAYAIFVCDDMKDKDAAALRDRMEQVDHVADVLTLADLSVPVEALPDEVRDIFYSKDGSGQLMFLFFDTTTSADETMDAIEELRSIAGEKCFLSSMSAIVTDTRDLVQKEIGIYVIIAVILSSIVMTLFLDSFLVPVLFLADIGMAILYNLGTNFIQGEISFITMSLVAVLQLAVTMDYSIFLYSSYQEQKRIYPDQQAAMARAIAATITSVTGSSLTTIAGFIALCFMSFTLGLDLGIVMAKGVVLGVISCVTILPALLLTFDGAIQKTSHKPLRFSTEKLTGFVVKHHNILAVIMVLLWIPAIFGYNRVGVYYKLDNSLPKYLNSVQANEKLDEEYGMNSVSMLLVDSDLSKKETKAMLNEMKQVDGVTFALGLDSVTGPRIPDELIPEEVRQTLESDHYKLMLVSSDYQVATDEVNEQCEQLNTILKSYDPKGMLIGEAACTKDLIEITDHDFKVVSAVSILAIFVLILLVLKSGLLPVLLVMIIELAIYINLGCSYYTGTTLPFVASICIGTIQLGATVDYAILMTTRYKRERSSGKNKEASVRIALSTSMHSIITSALGFFAATIGVGIYSDVDLIGSLCLLMARGALVSMVAVLIFLPSMYMLFDKVICKTTGGLRGIVKN
ncbi:MAG: RND family transporter [Butyricicoccaceae bacterium]